MHREDTVKGGRRRNHVYMEGRGRERDVKLGRKDCNVWRRYNGRKERLLSK